MKTLYVKISGYNTFYKAKFSIRISHKGNRIARLEEKTEISRYEYYKAPASSRFVFSGNLDREIHEYGNADMLDLLEAQEG